MGNKIKKEELDLMATQPVKEHVFFVENMQELQTLLQGIGDSACKSKLYQFEGTAIQLDVALIVS